MKYFDEFNAKQMSTNMNAAFDHSLNAMFDVNKALMSSAKTNIGKNLEFAKNQMQRSILSATDKNYYSEVSAHVVGAMEESKSLAKELMEIGHKYMDNMTCLYRSSTDEACNATTKK